MYNLDVLCSQLSEFMHLIYFSWNSVIFPLTCIVETSKYVLIYMRYCIVTYNNILDH